MIFILDLETVIAKVMMIRKERGLTLVTNYGKVERYIEAVNSVTSARNVNIQCHMNRGAKADFETKNKHIYDCNLAIISLKQGYEDFSSLQRMAKIHNVEVLRAMEDEKLLEKYGII